MWQFAICLWEHIDTFWDILRVTVYHEAQLIREVPNLETM